MVGGWQPEEHREDCGFDAKGAQEKEGDNGRVVGCPWHGQLAGKVRHVQRARQPVEQPGADQEEDGGDLTDGQILDRAFDLPARPAEDHEPKGRDQHDLKEDVEVKDVAGEERPVQAH
jgi:hypothetical protein